jgi:hypothetical protein
VPERVKFRKPLVVISKRLARARNPCGAMRSSSVAGISKSRPLLQRASNMLNCWKGKNSSIGAALCHHPLITIPVTKWKRREPGASSRTQKIAETVMIRREVTRIVGLRGLVGWWWFFLVESLMWPGTRCERVVLVYSHRTGVCCMHHKPNPNPTPRSDG